MMNEASKTMMIQYLQSMMNRFKEQEAKYGIEDRMVLKLLDSMLACKEMTEALIGEPVNLRLDGTVTVGF